MMNDVTLKQIAAVKATVHTGSHIWRSSLGSAAKYAPIHRWRLYKIAHCYKRTAPMNQTDSMSTLLDRAECVLPRHGGLAARGARIAWVATGKESAASLRKGMQCRKNNQ